MTTYRITPHDDSKHAVTQIEAGTHEEAARRISLKWHGPRATAQRSSGERGKGGMFQCYTRWSDDETLNSAGHPFHVFEEAQRPESRGACAITTRVVGANFGVVGIVTDGRGDEVHQTEIKPIGFEVDAERAAARWAQDNGYTESYEA